MEPLGLRFVESYPFTSYKLSCSHSRGIAYKEMLTIFSGIALTLMHVLLSEGNEEAGRGEREEV